MKKQCQLCHKKFEPKNYWHKYCSTRCRTKAWAMRNFDLVEKKGESHGCTNDKRK